MKFIKLTFLVILSLTLKAQVVADIQTNYLQAGASTNATSVTFKAANIFLISAINTNATIYYLRMYNLNIAPNCASATGFVETIPIPASTTGAGIVRPQHFSQPYTSGIAYCITGGPSSTDNTNAATGVFVTLLYK